MGQSPPEAIGSDPSISITRSSLIHLTAPNLARPPPGREARAALVARAWLCREPNVQGTAAGHDIGSLLWFVLTDET